MSSFNSVNFNLRVNKHIQRNIVFDGIKKIQQEFKLNELLYVGFGSVWFTDFILAHRELSIDDMISIEKDEIGVRRAKFNRPFKTVQVVPGSSGDVIPELLAKRKLKSRPWLIWLDYDSGLDECKLDDISRVIQGAPQNSLFLVTLNADPKSMGKASAARPERIKKLLGDAVPDDLSEEHCTGIDLSSNLGMFLQNFMLSQSVYAGRRGGFVPSFRIVYKDGSTMVTVGGMLANELILPKAKQLTEGAAWRGFPKTPVITPHLTSREVAVLRAALPSKRSLSRKTVQRLGFDLEEEQIKAFESHYRHYPLFAQVTS